MILNKLKTGIKYLLGSVRVKTNHISADKNAKVYIGKNVNVKGGRNICLQSGVCIRPNVDIWCNGGKIEIGAGTEIGQRSRISIAHELVIEEKVLLSPNIYITDCDHAYENISLSVMEQGIVSADNRVIIKEHSYVGINSVIVGNVTIGKHCIIGANSVVTKSVPDYSVAVGSPARIIKKYNFETKCWEKCR